MQVAQQNDFITHAVIGGKDTIDFGISNSAEFFNILSSTLYKDQKLAVVREVLCNAWDAHIEAGCTDRAVEVTLTPHKLTVQDFGNGIHHDDIGIIYGTYGNSTKKNDGKQTGGFGLGCKAPFAYTDHFEVTSTNAGVKTIYTMAKSSAQVGGKPGITTLAQFPSTETGLTVSMHLKPGDFDRFKQLVLRLARNGDMNVKLNEKQIDGLNFDTGVANWRITFMTEILDTPCSVMVRYGNVIYPVEGLPDEMREIYLLVESKLQSLTNRSSYLQPVILFQAPPHSIAVTPSRESLSMQEHTLKTLRVLMEAFVSEIDNSFVKESKTVLNAALDKAVQDKRTATLLNNLSSIPGLTGAANTHSNVNTPSGFAGLTLAARYPETLEFKKQDIALRVQKLSAAGLVDRGLADSFLKELEDCKGLPNYYVSKTDWQQKRVYGRLLKKLLKAGLDPKNLLIHDTKDKGLVNSAGLISVLRSKPTHLFHGLAYLENVIVITNAQSNLLERVKRLDGVSPSFDRFLVYTPGRKKDELLVAQKFFASTNMKVIDMTVLEKKESSDDKPKTSAGPKLKGLVSLKEMSKGMDYDANNRILDPEFVVPFTVKYRSDKSIDGLSTAATQLLKKYYGDKGGLATAGNQYATWSKKTKTAPQYLEEKVMAFVAANPSLKDFAATSIERNTGHLACTWLKDISNNARLAKMFGINVSITEEQAEYFRVFNWIGPDAKTQQGKDLWAEYKALPTAPKLQTLINKLETSKLLSSLDRYSLRCALESKKHQDKAIKLFLFALNN